MNTKMKFTKKNTDYLIGIGSAVIVGSLITVKLLPVRQHYNKYLNLLTVIALGGIVCAGLGAYGKWKLNKLEKENA